jgi:outer membrane receptor protein involved in Fe transport
LVVIDGEKLNNARTDPGASGAPIAIIDPSQLEAIEVVAGSGSSLYGSDSIGGTINLVTKSPARPTGDELIIGARLDGNYFSNGAIRRGNATLNISNNQIAVRGSFSAYRNANYNTGNEDVTIQQVLAIGEFYRQFPTNVAGTTFNSVAGYPVFSLPAGSEILNGQGSGVGEQIDAWFYPSEKHNFRGRFINRDEGNNGNAFSGPPYETQDRFSKFRSFQKFGLRYEGLDFASFLPRVSANYFYQRITFPQNQFTYTNVAGPTGSYLNGTTFTGLPSVFNISSFTDNRNSIGTYGIDLQATLLPFKGMFVTVGGGRTEDRSRDSFDSFTASGNGVLGTLTGRGASSPLTTYTDNNLYVQAEYDAVKWVRISGGLRFDNWVTEAQGGNGFPLSTEFTVLNAVAPAFLANPGALQQVADSLPDLIALAQGTGTSGSDRNSYAGNFGIVGRLPWGINPYFRVANSYREPGITERYLIRNFAPGSFFAPLVVGNPNLQPEKGLNYDVGVKIQQKSFNFTFGYFHNTIKDLLVYAPGQSYCVEPVPPALPGGFASQFFGCLPFKSVVNINARINQDENVIKGFESTGEVSIPLGGLGSLNPFYSLGSLHGTNKNPTAQQITIFNQLYNRSDTPIELTGSLNDFPLANITPFRVISGLQYLDAKGRFFIDYNWRHQNRVTRAEPNTFVGQSLINYGTFASLDSFDKHSIKAGYNWTNERYKFSLNGGVDNIADKLYWEHFQTAPAPGRSIVIGFTVEVFNF